MDIGTVTSLISSVGFPIACCFVCFWYIKKMNDEHRQEMEKPTDEINEVTVPISIFSPLYSISQNFQKVKIFVDKMKKYDIIR